jgi:hypothetical protein
MLSSLFCRHRKKEAMEDLASACCSLFFFFRSSRGLREGVVICACAAREREGKGGPLF